MKKYIEALSRDEIYEILNTWLKHPGNKNIWNYMAIHCVMEFVDLLFYHEGYELGKEIK